MMTTGYFQVDYAKLDHSHYFDTYEEAEKALKRKAAAERDGDIWLIYQAIAKAESPVPAIEVVKL